MHNFTAIAEQFKSQGQITDIHEFGNSINDTYLVTTYSNQGAHFGLQCINIRSIVSRAL